MNDWLFIGVARTALTPMIFIEYLNVTKST